MSGIRLPVLPSCKFAEPVKCRVITVVFHIACITVHCRTNYYLAPPTATSHHLLPSPSAMAFLSPSLPSRSPKPHFHYSHAAVPLVRLSQPPSKPLLSPPLPPLPQQNPPPVPTLNPISRPRTVMTRAIVIFADYLCDLVVLDIFSDIVHAPEPSSHLLSALAALPLAFMFGHLVSNLAAWAHRCYFSPGFFAMFLHTVTAPTLHRSPGLFDRLVNSCALVTVPLTLLVGWSEGVGGEIDHVFWEAFWVTSLSICALSPLLKETRDVYTFVRMLKGLSIRRRARGELGVWERVLIHGGVLPRVESALKAVGVRKVGEEG